MDFEVRLAQYGMGMQDGTILQWYKKEGEAVAAGEPLLEVEAAKTTVEVPAPTSGVLSRILVQAEQNIRVGTVIALISPAGTKVSQATAAAPTPVAATLTATQSMVAQPTEERLTVQVTPLARRVAKDLGVDLRLVKGTGPKGRITDEDVRSFASATPAAAAAARVQVEPRAQRAAKELDIDLSLVRGSGPDGRITEQDVRDAANAAGEPKQTAAVAAPLVQVASASLVSGQSDQDVERIPHSAVRRFIAQRLTEAKQQIPHFYLTVDCEIDALMAMRAEINQALPEAKLTVNDLITKTVATAMVQVPAANASWTDSAVVRYRNVDVSIAVSTPSGLITPVIRNANLKSLSVISAESKDLAARARENRLQPHEYEGGGFTISNLGMYGIREFSAIINPPQSCILAVGAGELRPVVKNGEICIATVMSCTLSVDHRALDGTIGAQFLVAFKSLIEHPSTMLGL